MLPGGLAVLGLYLFAPETGYTSAANQLLSTYPSLHTDFLAGTPDAFSTQALSSSSAVAAPAAVADGQSSQPAVSELLLLHIDSTTCKYSLKSTSVSPDTAPSTGSLKPCELKFGSSMSSLICLQATHDVDMQLPATAGGQQLQEHAQQAVAAEAARIYSAVGAIDQRVGEGAQVLADLLPATASIDQPVNVDLYYQVTASSTASSSGSLQSTTTPLLGTGQIQGCIYGLAYVHKREPISKAISQLKCDLVKSLTARLDLLADDALSAADTCDLEPAPDKPESDHTNSSKNGSSSSSSDAGAAAPAHPLLTVIGSKYATAKQICLPSRVLLPWVGGLQLCDYLSEGEGPADAVARANELLGTSLADSSQVGAHMQPAETCCDRTFTFDRGLTCDRSLACCTHSTASTTLWPGCSSAACMQVHAASCLLLCYTLLNVVECSRLFVAVYNHILMTGYHQSGCSSHGYRGDLLQQSPVQPHFETFHMIRVVVLLQVTQIESPAKPTTIKAAAVTVNNTTANQPTSQRSAVAFTPTVIAGATAAVVALLAATLGYLSLSNS